MKKIINLAACLLSSFLLVSCNVGLGEEVDLLIPEAKITNFADQKQTVGQVFEIAGTASDNFKVEKVEIKLYDTDSNVISEWTLKDNTCILTKDNDETQLPASEYTYTVNSDGSCDWSLASVTLAESGEYKINVKAFDSSGYESATTSDSQKSVVYDVLPPKVSITQPIKRFKTLTEIKDTLDSKVGEDGYKEFSMLDHYVNGPFKISGTQEENFTLKYLKVYIKNDKGYDIWKSKVLLGDEKYAQEAGVLKEGEEYQVISTLRSWDVEVPDLSSLNPINTIMGGPVQDKQYLQLITESCDGAGNVEKDDEDKQTVSQGWFCYWPQADKPWIDLNLGKTEDQAHLCYPGTKLQGYSYDDDGIESVVATRTYLKNNIKREIVLFERSDDDFSTYQTWNIVAPIETGKYKIEVTVQDVYGKKADIFEGYFSVSDINSPQIKVNSPEQTETLFGNKDGDIEFSISADDDSRINKIAAVYITNESDAAKYLDPKNSNWNLVNHLTTEKKDSNNNMLWYIEPKYVGVDSTGIGGARQVYSGTLKLNLFEDLKIDGKTHKLGGQHFIFYVDDGENALALDYAILGDVQIPTLTLTNMKVKWANTSLGEDTYDFSEAVNLGDPTNSTIKFTGTWGDDSFDAWQDKSKLSVKLLWNAVELPIVLNDDKTWVSEFKFANEHSSSVVMISAEISDYAGNTKKLKESLTIENEAANLESITSTKPDGNYALNEEIPIVLKFNKSINVTGTPHLLLNNGGIATFDTDSNGTSNLVFNYTTENGKDITQLDVEEIVTNGATFRDVSTNSDAGIQIPITRTLAKNKNIGIITTVPTFKAASITGDILSLEFSARVSKGAGNIEFTQSDATLTNVPAILSETEYRTWLKSFANLKNYYTVGTNGSSKEGVANLTTKYILNYEYDSNDETLLDAYKTSNLHKVVVSVKSGAVSVDDVYLKLDLKKFPLPCKGATYNIKIPSGLIYNLVGTANTQATDSVDLDGIETPVIRINKSKWTYDVPTKTATQPLTSQVKIDCETTGATITYATASKNSSYKDNTVDLGDSENTNYPQATSMPTAPTDLTESDLPFNIGSNSWEYGQKIFIVAQATKGSVKSEKSYEIAMRSVFVFDEDGGYGGGGEGRIVVDDLKKDPSDLSKDRSDGVPGVWIRGGDAETGSVTTAGFPLNHDEDDPCGASLLTKDSTADSGKWYYVTWEFTTTAYIEVLAGVCDELSETQGPKEWTYGMNAWVPFKKWYCVFPGESRWTKVSEYGWVWGDERGAFGFKKETTDRDGNEHSYNSSGTGGGGGGQPANPQHEPDNSPISAEDAALPGQLLTNYIDLSDGNGYVQKDENNIIINSDNFREYVDGPNQNTNWQEIYNYHSATLTIKTDSTFTKDVNAYVMVKSGYWGTLVDSANLSGGTLGNEERITPTPLENGTIIIELTAEKMKQIIEQQNKLLIIGYGVKITSMTLVENP